MTLPLTISLQWLARLRIIGITLAVLLVLQRICNYGLRNYLDANGGPAPFQAAAQIKTLAMNIKVFQFLHGRYPNQIEGLEEVFNPPKSTKKRDPAQIEKLLTDPWNHKLIYRCPGKLHTDSYDLISLGEDGEEGTADDVTN